MEKSPFETSFVASIKFLTGFIKLLVSIPIIKVKTEARATFIDMNKNRPHRVFSLSLLTIFNFVPIEKPILTINMVTEQVINIFIIKGPQKRNAFLLLVFIFNHLVSQTSYSNYFKIRIIFKMSSKPIYMYIYSLNIRWAIYTPNLIHKLISSKYFVGIR